MFADAHNHLLSAVSPEKQDFFFAAADTAGISLLLVNSVTAADWEPLAALTARYPQMIFPFYGIHPWHEPPAGGWCQRLSQLLASAPGGIGEIGLDTKKSTAAAAVQEKMLTEQLQIAFSLRRPAALHCLNAAPRLFQILYPQFAEVKILLHAFSGDIAWARKFLDRGAFFSFPGSIFPPARRRARELLRFVPADRLLLETDAPARLPQLPKINDALAAASAAETSSDPMINSPLHIPLVYYATARERQMPLAKLEGQILLNLRELIGQ